MFQLVCDDPLNPVNYCNPDYDAAYGTLLQTVDAHELEDAWATAQEILAQDLPIFVYRRPSTSIGYHDNVGGVQMFEDGLLRLELLTTTE